MKEEWLMSGAIVPVDIETTAALVAEIHRLIGVVGGMALAQQRTWVGLTDEEIKEIVGPYGDMPVKGYTRWLFDKIEAKLKDKNR
jgi:hypothetical protein